MAQSDRRKAADDKSAASSFAVAAPVGGAITLGGGILAARHVAHSDVRGLKDTVANAFQQLFNRDMADNKPARFRKLDPKKIVSDPNTFQFKSGGDNHGVTDRLKGVKSWDNVAAGKAVVFERANGELVIADGHQRLGLAKRLSAEGQKINMDAYVLRERDGWSARDVYAYAALKNIKESSGQALDMAKVMRERPDLVNGSVPMSDAKVRDAANLSKLSKPAFDMVVGGAIKPEAAAQVGARIGDSTRHADLLTEMAKANVSTAQHAGLYVDQALAAGSITEHQNSLFGEETKTRSLIAERAAVLDKALTALKSDKRIFALLEREAGTIEDAGNKLSHETNAARAGEAGNQAALIERLAKTRGPVSDMLETAARDMASGKTPSVAARSFVKAVGDTLKSGGMNALVGGDAMPAAPRIEPDPNQNSMFDAPEPKKPEPVASRAEVATPTPAPGGEHHVWDDKARAASAQSRQAKAKPKSAPATAETPAKAAKSLKAAKAPKAAAPLPKADPARKAKLLADASGKVGASLNTFKAEAAELHAEGLIEQRTSDAPSTGGKKTRWHRTDKPLPEAAAAEAPAPVAQAKAPAEPAKAATEAPAPAKKPRAAKAPKTAKAPGPVENRAIEPPAPKKPFGNILQGAPVVDHAKTEVDRRIAERIKNTPATKPEPSVIHDDKGRPWTKGKDGAWSVDHGPVTVEKATSNGSEKIPPRPASAPKTTSGKRGTQNAANLEAINANKKAKAKGKTGTEQARERGMASRAKTHNDRVASGAKKAPKGAAVMSGLDVSPAPAPAPKKKSAVAAKADKYVAAQEAKLGKPADTTLATPKRFDLSKIGAPKPQGQATGALGGTDADRERRYMSRMRAGDSQKTDAELKADFASQASKPSVAEKMKAKMAAETPAPSVEAKPVTAKPGKARRSGAVGKTLGLLAPIAIGAAMIATANEADAAGLSTADTIKEVAKTGAEGAGTMAGFMAAHAGAVAAAGKFGISAAKAVPGVNALMMAGNAAYEAWNAPAGHKLEAAAKGAWDMSLPGMIAGTAQQVGALLPQTHNVGGRGASRTPNAGFEHANQAFKAAQSASAGQQTSTISDQGATPGNVRRGWANPKVQAAAKEAQGRKFQGFTRSDLR